MKVILLQDVAKIGSRSEIVEVPDGYAMNQLIPKRMAEPATKANVKRVERLNEHKAAGKEAAVESFETAVATIEATPITITVEANEKGHLFKAISPEEVVVAAQAVGAVITDEMVSFTNPIKEIGEHQVTLTQADQTATISITVAGKENTTE
jgi:large subunit ribosomal protein L9